MHRRTRTAFLFTLILLLNPFALWAEDKKTKKPSTPAEPVMGVVNGVPITKEAYFIALQQYNPDRAREVLLRLIDFILIDQKAAAKKVSVSESEIQARALAMGFSGEVNEFTRKSVRASLLIEKLVVPEKKLRVSSSEIAEYFEEHTTELNQPEKLRLRYFFTKDRIEADDTHTALKAGADFAALAKAKSQDMRSRAAGGDMGYVSPGMLQPEIETVVYAMKPNQLSRVVSTSSGFHIFRLEEKVPAKKAVLDKETSAKIKTKLLEKKIHQVLPDWLAALRKSAQIK